MSKFTLSTYLMLSVVFILSGIAWIILSQTDGRFNLIGESDSLDTEQDEILRQYYQLQDKYLPKEKQSKPVHKILTSQLVSVPVKPLNITPAEQQKTALPEVWNTRPSFDVNENLRNNPWSPDYQPGY